MWFLPDFRQVYDPFKLNMDKNRERHFNCCGTPKVGFLYFPSFSEFFDSTLSKMRALPQFSCFCCFETTPFLVRLKGLEPTHISVREPKSRMSTNSITGAKEKPCCRSSRVWSGQRGSNSLPPPWQGGALPDELCPRQCLLFYHKKRSCQVFSCTAAKGRQSRAYSETSSEILAQTGKMKYTHTICQKGEKKWNFKRF